LAMALGEISNLAVLAVIYNLKRTRDLRGISKKGIKRKRVILSELLKTSAPVSANRFIISIMSAFEYILIPGMLVAGGLNYKSSMELYGRLSGMALPLIFFPSLVTSSLAITLVPAISEAVSLKNFNAMNYRISKSIQITFILGIVFTAVFMTYPNELGSLIYKRESIGDLLYMLSFSCTFIYLQQTLMGVLNGLGKQGVLLRNTVIGSTIRIGFVYFLIPVYGIRSYVWGLVTSFLITACINLLDINRITGLLLDIRNWVLKPGIVGVIMIITGRYIYDFFGIFTKNSNIVILFTLATNVFTGFFLMVVTGVLKKDEVLALMSIKKHRTGD
jgi:stage V sporulation protein B